MMASACFSHFVGNYFPSIAGAKSTSEAGDVKKTRNLQESSTVKSVYPIVGHILARQYHHPPEAYMLPPQVPSFNPAQSSNPTLPYNNHTFPSIIQQHAGTYVDDFRPDPCQMIPTPPISKYEVVAGSVSFQVSPTVLNHFENFEDVQTSSAMDEYAAEVDQFMKEMEIVTLPNVTNIDAIQSEVSWKHRKTLILWLIEVHIEYDLRPETLYLAVNFIDRVCAKRIIRKQHYQLLGLTCLWIASKYEENHGRVPSPKTLVALLDYQFRPSDFAIMEKLILSDLNFVLGHPTPEAFLKAHCKNLDTVKPPIRALSRLIMELSLIHRRFRPFRPSVLALASLILADSLYSCRFWTHSEPLFGRIISNLEECLLQTPKQIIDKYRSAKFLGISLHVKRMLENKAAILYQTRLQTSQTQPGGILTPPKDHAPSHPPPLIEGLWASPDAVLPPPIHRMTVHHNGRTAEAQTPASVTASASYQTTPLSQCAHSENVAAFYCNPDAEQIPHLVYPHQFHDINERCNSGETYNSGLSD